MGAGPFLIILLALLLFALGTVRQLTVELERHVQSLALSTRPGAPQNKLKQDKHARVSFIRNENLSLSGESSCLFQGSCRCLQCGTELDPTSLGWDRVGLELGQRLPGPRPESQ